ncbi:MULTISPECIES: DUF350 domain-containing protein [Undibacterium]|jgi:putative membrane protein|uniref:DUF350 domain-containing protein n=1 Tax=Undibacterium umbellatum TaxID=2762300 RepID=A0ABR6ZA80_9BURK|nr:MULTISPECIES: DUF350 domain-containing protein [Undibacterium]MBC3908668.1 DUF350 domain-containing protein [Undibacterium umbellatum]MDP1976761.1 DUF350 domain-containing protein [Undibacterium sp.]
MSEQLLAHGLVAFFSHIAAAFVLLTLFIVVYIRITPYREIALIREGNIAAAASLSGALLGYCTALASAIANSVSVIDMSFWGLVALVIQLLAFGIARLLIPGIISDIPNNKIASGIFLGALSLGLGMINASCMTY